ncbi:MAG: glycosyltransferase [Proteobacteria bacterium]|nr:glycosyltransferase [Pseudomonadota bacterium]
MDFQPTVSIIIAVKNAKVLLQETLQSIRMQQYPFLEVIVIDGKSTDGTQDVINENKDVIKVGLSEADNGISDAFNKGLQHASGDYINFQGAGDILYASNCISQLFKGIDASVTLVCGKVLRVDEDGITPIWAAPKTFKPFNARSLLFKMSLPHQGLFTHRSFFERFGQFDTTLKFAMDYDLLLRAFYQFPKTMVKDIFISKWRAGGVGKNKIFDIFDEYHRIKANNQIASPLTLKLIDKFSRTKYMIKNKLGLAY